MVVKGTPGTETDPSVQWALGIQTVVFNESTESQPFHLLCDLGLTLCSESWNLSPFLSKGID